MKATERFLCCRSGSVEPIKRGVEFLTSFKTALSWKEEAANGMGAGDDDVEDKAETVSGH